MYYGSAQTFISLFQRKKNNQEISLNQIIINFFKFGKKR